MRVTSLATAAGIMIFWAQGAIVQAAEITVLSTPTLKTAMEELGPEFQRVTGHKLVMSYDGVAPLKKQIEAGAPFDVAILLPSLIDDLIKQGKIAANSRADIARTAAGVAVRAGGPKPDVGSVDALRRTLLDAKSISYGEESASGRYFLGLLDRLGIAAEIKPKLKAISGGAVVEAVAKGDAEMTVITVPNIVGVSGVEMAGLLPAEVQNYTVFTAGVGAESKTADAAQALIGFLLAPAATTTIIAKGMERITP